jgi:lysyl-tRNA synthetase class 2
MNQQDNRGYVQEARREKLEKLKALGVAPFAYSYTRTHLAAEALAAYQPDSDSVMRLAGRVVSFRRHGKTTFAHLEDASGRIQIYFRKDEIGEEAYEVVKLIDLGDFIGVEGGLFMTRTEEITVKTASLEMLSKALRPLPMGKQDSEGDVHGGLSDSETRFRQRYADLAVHPDVQEIFKVRARAVSFVRRYLEDLGYLEVETPVLQPLYGGAMARPFTTHHNTLDTKMYLRIATELYLKRLIVGGLEKVYEIGKDFRNEGIDRTHNPEFTMLEFYEAFADYETMVDITEGMVAGAVEEIAGSTVVERFGKELDFSKPFKKASFFELVEEHAGIELASATESDMRELLASSGEDEEMLETFPRTKLIDELFGIFVEPKLIQPTFVLDYPIEMSPLAKPKRGDPSLAERFELFVNGTELANAFSELNDPDDQRDRFEAQVAARAAGDEEAQQMDEDYVRAMEFGMPPTGGCGLGIDRLVMLLTDNSSIREVILFPTMRPEE